jgi:hypothetical protein
LRLCANKNHAAYAFHSLLSCALAQTHFRLLCQAKDQLSHEYP